MEIIGVSSSYIKHIVDGTKTVDLRLGTPKYLKIRKGMRLHIREDAWEGDQIISSEPTDIVVVVKQVLYFESFEEAFGAVGFQATMLEAVTPAAAIQAYRQFYSAAEEYENGVVAFIIGLA